MRLTLSTALAFALIDSQEVASKGGTAGQDPSGAATKQASEFDQRP
jgi:hypothetical protein